MTAIPILLAEAVTTVINDAVADEYFSMDFTARRSYPDWDLEYKDLNDTDAPAVDVVFISGQSSGGDTVELDSYGSLNYQPAVDVCVRFRFDPSDRDATVGRLRNSSVDPLVKLIEEIHELLASGRITSLQLNETTEADWVDANIRAYVNQRRLREGMFEGVVRVNFSVTRQV
jgi:hypothetical protein